MRFRTKASEVHTQALDKCPVRRTLTDRVAWAGPSEAEEAPGSRAADLPLLPSIDSQLTERQIQVAPIAV